jgi:hypothetical protein
LDAGFSSVLGRESAVHLKIQKRLNVWPGLNHDGAAVAAVAAAGPRTPRTGAVETVAPLSAAAGGTGDNGFVNKQRLILGREDMDSVGGLETNGAVFQRKEREIAALAHEVAGEKPRALLADQDAARLHELAGEAFHAAAFGTGIASVFGTS